ncbi:uncharacterized protein [Antedon mediterranea]
MDKTPITTSDKKITTDKDVNTEKVSSVIAKGKSPVDTKNKLPKKNKKLTFDHNPVFGTCDDFKINTFNINSQDITKSLETLNISQDIIFLQESKNEEKEQKEYLYTYTPEGQICNGMLLKKTIFEIDPDAENQKYVYAHRRHTLILRHCNEHNKKVVAISWHGPNDKSKEEEAFKDLMDFANEMKGKYQSSPVIIGGDFNVDKDTVETWLKDDYKEFEVAAPALKGNRVKNKKKPGPGKKNIDFFVHSKDHGIEEVDSIDVDVVLLSDNLNKNVILNKDAQEKESLSG